MPPTAKNPSKILLPHFLISHVIDIGDYTMVQLKNIALFHPWFIRISQANMFGKELRLIEQGELGNLIALRNLIANHAIVRNRIKTVLIEGPKEILCDPDVCTIPSFSFILVLALCSIFAMTQKRN